MSQKSKFLRLVPKAKRTVRGPTDIFASALNHWPSHNVSAEDVQMLSIDSIRNNPELVRRMWLQAIRERDGNKNSVVELTTINAELLRELRKLEVTNG